MATPLDISLLGRFGLIFPFLLVLVVVYAVLSKIKVFGDRKGLDALIAFVIAVLVLFSDTAVKSIELMAPWMILFFFLLVFVMIAFMVLGVKEEGITGAFKSYPSIGYWILAVVLIIWIGSVTTVLSEKGGVGKTVNAPVNVSLEGGNVAAPDQQSAFWATLTNPKVLGLGLILLIATFTVQRLASTR